MMRMAPIPLTLGMGLLLCGVGVPRLQASINVRYGQPALDQLEVGTVFPTLPALDLLVQSHEIALDWAVDPIIAIDLGNGYLSRAAFLAGQGGDPSPDFGLARQAFGRALAVSPASYMAWYLLAQTEILALDPQAAAKYLAGSYRVIPLDFINGPGRLALCLQVAQQLNSQTFDLAGKEMSALARIDLEALTKLALYYGHADTMKAMMKSGGADKELLDDYDQMAGQLLATLPK